MSKKKKLRVEDRIAFLKKLPGIKRSKTKLLAIDPAVKTGWALSFTEYGLLKLEPSSPKKQNVHGNRLFQLEGFLKKHSGVDFIAAEMPVYSGQANSFLHHSKLVGLIEKFCHEHKIPIILVSPTEIKMAATGKGNASKEEMIESAEKLLGYEGSDDNEADALWIRALALEKLNK